MKSMPQHEEDAILNFISAFCGVSRSKISIKSEIVADLNIDGDDAIELVEELSNLLNADATNFDFSAYFVSEAAFNPINGLIALFKGKDNKKALSIKGLVEQLVNNKLTID